jgi:hypothetical protein
VCRWDLALLIKAFITLEGIGRELDQQFCGFVIP